MLPKTLPLLVALMVTVTLVATPSKPEKRTLVITHVSVIDATGGPEQTDMTVVIDGDRITTIGKSTADPLPKNAQVVEGKGKFLIPGLWDMHVHLAGNKDVFFPLFIANGVTGVRDMGIPWDQLSHVEEWRKEIAAGTILGPRILTPGPILTGPKPPRTVWPGSLAIADREAARDAVDRLVAAGVDFIKVHNAVPRQAYFGVVDEASKKGIPFAGHTPDYISAFEASNSHQKSIEHLSGILVACSSNEPALRKELMETMPTADILMTYRGRRRIETTSLATFSNDKASELFTLFIKNGTWQVPTVINLRQNDFPDRIDPDEESLSRYVPLSLRTRTKEIREAVLKELTPDDFASGNRLFQKQIEIVSEMKRRGVQLLAGTDMVLHPGFSLHGELQLLVQAGLTPMEALQTATRNPAKYFGNDAIGTIEKNKIADLVLLNSDPLKDIRNTRDIEAVIVAGRLVSASERQKLLAQAETAASQPTQ